MAAIDGLLALVGSQGAEGLILEAGKPPVLTSGGGMRPLTMPPLDERALEGLLLEVAPADKKAAIRGLAPVEMAHVSPKLGPVVIHASRATGTLCLKITRRAATASAAAATPAGDPAAVAPAAVAPAAVAPAAVAPAAVAATAVAATATPPPPPAMATTYPGAPAAAWPLLRQALLRGASDVILSTSAPPAVRVAGEMVELDAPPLGREELLALFGPALTPQRRDALAATGSVDLAFEAHADELQLPRGRRFRVNVFTHLDGISAALRPLWETIPALDELHLPARLLGLVAPSSGLVLVAGLAGSGKSTTLAVLVEHLNTTSARHIITLEDPIEFVFRRQRSVVHQREVGTHVESFAVGLRAALRESPDVILVGELRDRESIGLALTAAETGHLVLATIHSASAATAIDRIVDVFAESQQLLVRAQLANVLRTVVTQRLLPGRETGTRVPVLEILNVNHAVASHVREGKVHMIPTQMQVGADEAMLTFDRCLVDLSRRGLLAPDVAVAAAREPDWVRGAIREPRGGLPGGRPR